MAPTDTNDASASKSSLLWAYQLRQEHVHLVGRIDNIDADLHSSAEKTNGFTQSFSDLQTLIKALESENGNLKSEMNAMNDVLLCTVKRLDHYLKKTPENISKIQADHGSLSIRVQQLANDAAELRAGIQHVENKCAVLGKKQVAMAPSFLLKLKYKKKVDEMGVADGNQDPNRDTSPAVTVTNNGSAQAPQNESCSTDQMDTASPPADVVPDSGSSSPVPVSLEDVILQIRQDDQDLPHYLAIASTLRSQLPPRKQEGSMTEAFFEGLKDDNIKQSMEQYLDKYGWIWSNLEHFCEQQEGKVKKLYNLRTKAPPSRRRAKPASQRKAKTTS